MTPNLDWRGEERGVEAAPPKLGDVVRNPFNDNKPLTAAAAGADVEEFWRVVAVVEYNPLFQTIQPQWPGRYCPAQTAAVVRKQTSRLKQKAAKSDDISQSVSSQWRVNSRDWGP